MTNPTLRRYGNFSSQSVNSKHQIDRSEIQTVSAIGIRDEEQVKLTCLYPSCQFNGAVGVEVSLNKLGPQLSEGSSALRSIWSSWKRGIMGHAVPRRNSSHCHITMQFAITRHVYCLHEHLRLSLYNQKSTRKWRSTCRSNRHAVVRKYLMYDSLVGLTCIHQSTNESIFISVVLFTDFSQQK